MKTPVPETLVQVFSCEFYEILKNTCYRTPPDNCFWIELYATDPRNYQRSRTLQQ